MNAAEHIRHFLTVRNDPDPTVARAVSKTEGLVSITEADLEAVVQTLEIMTDVLRTHAMQNPPVIITQRMLNTSDELDAVSQGTLIESSNGRVFQKLSNGWYLPGSHIAVRPEDIALPAWRTLLQKEQQREH